MTATVVITSRNRRDELRVAVQSAVAQAGHPEVLVIDDGSTDGTSEMIRAEFPGVRLVRHVESRGLIVRRNEGARLATGDVVFSIDDDAAFSTPDIVRATLRDLETPRIGAVAIPYIDVHRSPQVRQAAPDRTAVYVTDRFIGTAHAVRRDVFQRVGGYRDPLVHQGEEGDFCIRMLAAGYVVRLGTSEPIQHFESPKRDVRRMDYYGVRNAILFAWQNVPVPFVFMRLPLAVVRCLALTFAPARLKTRIAGLVDGFRQCASAERRPVPRQVYRLSRLLASAPRPLDAIAGLCPSPIDGAS